MAAADIKNKLIVGDIVPDFTTTIQSGKTVSLYNILRSGQKVLLIFYPGDMTAGCTKQLCSIRDEYDEYKQLGVTVFGVNHSDAASHQKFIDAHKFPFDIIVDTDRRIIKEYGLLGSFFGNPTTKRTVFLIDTSGSILYRFSGIHDNNKIFDVLRKKI